MSIPMLLRRAIGRSRALSVDCTKACLPFSSGIEPKTDRTVHTQHRRLAAREEKRTMSFFEVETWRIGEGHTVEEHDEMMRAWFRYVKEHHADMFAEWKSARYYRELTRSGEPTGKYIILFEFHTHAGFLAYKERRKDWSGPYAEYKTVDPYEIFDHDTVTTEYWEPQESQLWFEFPESGS
jgi:hypothetical protein